MECTNVVTVELDPSDEQQVVSMKFGMFGLSVVLNIYERSYDN